MKETCVICGEEIEGYGNNPAPVKDEGQCCDDCNLNTVVPARLATLGLESDEVKGTDSKVKASDEKLKLVIRRVKRKK